MRSSKISQYLIASIIVVLGASAPAMAAGEETPKEVFDRVGCWSCHGYEGQGGRHGPVIVRSAHSLQAFSAFVRNTAGRMPPFTERMVPEDDIEAIYTYLQSIPEPPSPEGISLLQGIFPDQ